MVDGVLHNACLRMEESGEGLGDLIRANARRRWFGRTGLAVGGAASLAIGAALGGVLEGIPIWLAPPANATASPQIAHGGSADASPFQLTSLDEAVATARAAAGALAAAAPTFASGAGGASSRAAAANGPNSQGNAGSISLVSGGGAGSGGGGSVVETANPHTTLPNGSAPGLLASPTDAVGQVLGSVGQVASQLPAVGSTAGGVLGALGGVSSSVPSSPSGDSSSSPLSGVTSTITNCATGLMSPTTTNCNSSTSAPGGL